MTRPGTPPSGPPQLGGLKRALLVVVGGVLAVVGVVLALLLAWVFWDSARRGVLAGQKLFLATVVTVAALALFAALVAMGVRRVRRGIRGDLVDSRPFGAGLEAVYRRYWYPVGLLAWTALSLLGIAASGGVMPYVAGGRPFMGRIPLHALMAFIVLPIHVAIHELGHALAGAAVGLRFISLRVGWLQVDRASDRLQLRWAPLNLPEVLGLHVAVPSVVQTTRWRRVVHALGGPLATLAGTLAFALMPPLLGPPVGAGTWLVSQFLLAGCWVGLVLGLVNLLPLRTRSGLMTDGGAALQNLWPEKPARRAFRLFQENWALGRRPRDWGISAAAFLEAAREDPKVRDALVLAAVSVLIDSGERPLASSVLRDALSAPGGEPDWIRELELQAVMIEAFEGRIVDAARRLERIAPPPGLEAYPRLAQAVVAAASGRGQEAADALDAWERAVAATGRAAAVRFGNEWAVDELRARLATLCSSDRARVT